MRMGVLGINHKLAAVPLRERLASCCHRWVYSPFPRRCPAALVLLSTCNRTEIYFSSEELAVTHTEILAHLREWIEEKFDEFDQKLYTYFGVECFRHLVRVTAGLDSAIRGETEIQGQVALAYAEAMKGQALTSELHFLFQKGLKLGKQVRTLIPFARGMPELHDAILHLGALFFASPRQARILFVGASAIHALLIATFCKRGFTHLTVCNRTLKHAQALCQQHQLQSPSQNPLHLLPWEAIQHWTQYDWVLCATKAPHFLLTPDTLCYPKKRQLLMDLSVPRNIDPTLSHDPSITLYHLDAIQETLSQSRLDRLELFIEAERWVEQAAMRQMELFHGKCRTHHTHDQDERSHAAGT